MGFWKKLFGDDAGGIDYYREGVELQRAGNYHEALTSFRLALRDAPLDPAVLQQMAITYTRIGMMEEAAKTYRTVLSSHPEASGAHYGLAFLLLRQGQPQEAEKHLRAFLQSPPESVEAQRHVAHARSTLEELERGVVQGET
jgi:Tfp pilus assembly protein PilF